MPVVALELTDIAVRIAFSFAAGHYSDPSVVAPGDEQKEPQDQQLIGLSSTNLLHIARITDSLSLLAWINHLATLDSWIFIAHPLSESLDEKVGAENEEKYTLSKKFS